MAEGSEKVPIARVGPDDVEQCLPPVSAAGRHRPGRDGMGDNTNRVGSDRDTTSWKGTGPSGSGRDGTDRDRMGWDGLDGIGTKRVGVGWDGTASNESGPHGMGWGGSGQDATDRDGTKRVGSDRIRTEWIVIGSDQDGSGPVRTGTWRKEEGGQDGSLPAPSPALSAGVRGGGAPRAGAAAEGGGRGADRRSPPAPGRGHRRLLLLESHRAAGEPGSTARIGMGLLVACTGEAQLGNASCEVQKEVFKQIFTFFSMLSEKTTQPNPIIIIFTGSLDGASWKHIS